jgi:hypothetical protein
MREAQLPQASQTCTFGTVGDCAADELMEFCTTIVTSAAAITVRTAFVYRSTMFLSRKFCPDRCPLSIALAGEQYPRQHEFHAQLYHGYPTTSGARIAASWRFT